jgi:hypothetical protein
MVFLYAKGKEVSERGEAKQSGRFRLLEGHRDR